MIKALINLICCFVQRKKWRKKIRYSLLFSRERRKELLGRGFKINDDIIVTPEGVRIDISDKADYPLYLIKEVFLKVNIT